MLALMSWERINQANYLSRASAADAIRVKHNTQITSTSARRGAPTKVKPSPNRFVPQLLFISASDAANGEKLSTVIKICQATLSFCIAALKYDPRRSFSPPSM
jgi:hypothetical protein